jgi:hypothetical protein
MFAGPLRSAVVGEHYLIATPRTRTIVGTPRARRAVTVIAATSRGWWCRPERSLNR